MSLHTPLLRRSVPFLHPRLQEHFRVYSKQVHPPHSKMFGRKPSLGLQDLDLDVLLKDPWTEVLLLGRVHVDRGDSRPMPSDDKVVEVGLRVVLPVRGRQQSER